MNYKELTKVKIDSIPDDTEMVRLSKFFSILINIDRRIKNEDKEKEGD